MILILFPENYHFIQYISTVDKILLYVSKLTYMLCTAQPNIYRVS